MAFFCGASGSCLNKNTKESVASVTVFLVVSFFLQPEITVHAVLSRDTAEGVS